jgi:ankyrin repeat protein
MLALVLAFALSSPLIEAVKSDDRAAALRLIARGEDVNAAEPDGTTALHWAAARNDLDLAQRLLAAGAKAAVRNQYGATPMSEAAAFGSPALLGALLQAGGDVESPNADGQTALMLVARTGNVDAAALLLKHGANVNAREGWKAQTALMWAAAQKQSAMVRALVGAGADVNARSTVHEWQRQVTAEPRALHRPAGGLTPLLFAVREGCRACVEALLDAGADIDMADPEEISPLIMAVTNGHFDLASYLIDRGADIQKWDIFGRTPLYAAVDLNTLPHGGRPDAPSLDGTSSLQLIAKLLTAGANPNAQLKLLPPFRSVIDDRAMDNPLTIGATPLLRAAKGLDAPAIALLLKHGARVDLPSGRGLTPLLVAAGAASTDADSRGLYTTADVQERAIASLELLVAAGADVNAKERGRGLTALHEAARWGWNDVVRFLIDRGADIQAADVKGLTAVDSALGRAGGNGRFGQRIDVNEETAALLRSLGGREGAAGAPGAPARPPARP